jgi:hypothetical protein
MMNFSGIGGPVWIYVVIEEEEKTLFYDLVAEIIVIREKKL